MTEGIIILVASIILFLVLMTLILPKMFLKVHYSVGEAEDRGIKRCKYKGKRCVIYEAGPSISKYINQYLLIEGENCKILRCKTSYSIKYLEYDVVVFDRYNEVNKIINVKESLIGGDYTRRVELPLETAYVKIIPRAVDGEVFKKQRLAFIPKEKITLYTIFSIVVTVLEAFALKVGCAYAFGGVFRESFVRSSAGTGASIFLAIATGIVGMIIVICSIKHYSKR